MSVDGGADCVVSTVSGPEVSLFAVTRYPSPGVTLRNNRPPRSLAFLVATTWPAGSSSDACAPGGRPVAYTCSTLPCALNDGSAALPPLAKTSASAVPTRKREIPRETRRAVVDTPTPPQIGQALTRPG